MQKVFDMYAKYYDLLYKDKNYAGEVEYVQKFIDRYNPKAQSILDLGCGTGKHDLILARNGFNVTGVELSEKMIDSAIENKNSDTAIYSGLKFYQGDIRSIRLEEKFDVIISMFHVMSYQTTNADIMKTLTTVKEHLKDNGIFLFDFWYGPAVLNERPESRVKKLEDDEVQVVRYAEPVLHLNENIVDVNYKVLITEKASDQTKEVIEKHSMRYLFIPEIKFFLNSFGMDLLCYEEWLTGKQPDDKSWSVFAAAGNLS